MSRRAARIDSNHAEIVRAMRDLGASVQSLAAVGKNCPDVLIGWQGRNFVLEVKAAKGTVSDGQAKWMDDWRGQVAVVRSIAEALLVVLSGREHRQYCRQLARGE